MKTRLSISQRRLRALARRVLRVADRQKSDAGIATVAVKVVPAAEAYIKVYDEAVRVQTTKDKEMAEGRVRVAELDWELRKGVAIVRYVTAGFDPSVLTGSVTAPDQLVSDANKVLELLAQAGEAVQQGQSVIETLAAAKEKAEAAWTKAQAARVALQEQQTIVRDHAVMLNQQLVGFRRVLHAALGGNHLDYQMLRANRVITPEVVDEDDTTVEGEELVATPANDSNAKVSDSSTEAAA